MAISKVILDGQVQMDVTQDTVTANALLAGYTATRADGEKIDGYIETKSASDVTASGAYVSAPAGYYPYGVRKGVQSGSEGIPIATKSLVSNHSVTITPSVTNTEGYISGSTKTGRSVSVSASELVSGSQSITSNRTVDVTNLAEVVVNVPPNNQDKTVEPSLSQQIITADSGYTGLGNVVVTAIPQGTAGTPTATKGTVSNNSISITPSVTNSEGYIQDGTLTGDPVTVSASELVSGSRTIIANQTVDVTNLAEVVVDVGGTIINQNKTVDPSTTVQQITFDEGYSGLGTVTVNAMPEGEEGIPIAETETDSSTNNIVVTPKVTNSAGYISGGLKVGEPVVINPGVTSFNGSTGDVTYTAPVTSVNGNTGAVTVTVPTKVSQLTNDSGYITGVQNASTSVKGIVQLSDSVSSTSTSLAATANAVRSAYNHGGVTSVNNKTGAVSLTIPTIYVTEEGTSGSWSYRKWSNKTYECWATIQAINGYVSSGWGSGDAVYTTFGQYSYPVTFKSAPFEIISSTRGTKTLFIANDGDKPNTTTKTAGYLAWRPTNAQVSISFYVTFYVKGTLP